MKIIGSDYDGTLNHNGIDEKKINAIDEWRKAGNIFAIISGRGVVELLELYNKNKLVCDYLVADNGAVIMKPDGTVVCDTRCDGSIAKPLLQLLFEKDCPFGEVHTSFPCTVLKDKKDACYTMDDVPHIPYFTQISTMLDSFEDAEKVTKCVKSEFGKELNPLQNGRCIDIVRYDMNKAKGLYRLMDITGAKYEDVIAVGDNINDEDMLREFRSYAMANGVPYIKEIANDITEGITELIEKELG